MRINYNYNYNYKSSSRNIYIYTQKVQTPEIYIFSSDLRCKLEYLKWTRTNMNEKINPVGQKSAETGGWWVPLLLVLAAGAAFVFRAELTALVRPLPSEPVAENIARTDAAPQATPAPVVAPPPPVAAPPARTPVPPATVEMAKPEPPTTAIARLAATPAPVPPAAGDAWKSQFAAGATPLGTATAGATPTAGGKDEKKGSQASTVHRPSPTVR